MGAKTESMGSNPMRPTSELAGGGLQTHIGRTLAEQLKQALDRALLPSPSRAAEGRVGAKIGQLRAQETELAR